MARSLNEKLNQIPRERRQRILAEAERLHAEYLTLQDLRKAKMLTQNQTRRISQDPPSNNCTDGETE